MQKISCMIRHLTYIIISLIIFSASAQAQLKEQLFLLPDVVFEKIETPKNYKSAYKLMIRQPLDHDNPEAGYFYQKVYLSHKGYDRPTAIITNGYNRNSNNITEVARILDANQLNVEHRYFGESVPDSLDYSYLNFKQITADLHRIRVLFDEIYAGKWVSSGISKGGTTTIFYRYFYPDDVVVSIPYVAPINHSDEDPRIYTFLDTIGTDECRAKILAFQKDILRHSEDARDKLKWFTKGKGFTFDYLGFDQAFEYAVLEYPFSFWQYGHDCSKIPGAKAELDEKIQHLLDLVGLEFYADASMTGYASHYYQSATEMGYYGYQLDKFRKLLKFIPTDKNPSASFTPNKMKVSFDGKLTNKVADWTLNNDEEFIYINGALDTWSATAVPPYESQTSMFFFIPEKHHATARINNMSADNQKKLKKQLYQWLDLDMVSSDKKEEK